MNEKDLIFWSFSTKSAEQPVNRLYVCDEIARYQSWFGDEATPSYFRYQLSKCQGDIEVMIDSPGGDAFAGNAIYDMLREYSASGKGRIVAKVSLAASAASIIAMAADEIQISVVGTIMIHNPWSMMQGNAKQLRATADVLDEIREGQIRAYMQKTGLSYEKIVGLMDGEGDGTYMNAKTAMELGFADKIINEGDEGWVSDVAKAKIAACMIRMEDQDEDEEDDETPPPEEPEEPEKPDDSEEPEEPDGEDEEDEDKDDEEERDKAKAAMMLAGLKLQMTALKAHIEGGY